MRYLSLFSGVEAATVAWKPLGWECVGVAEIEPFPCAVLQRHYPNTPNLGDISKITKKQIINLGHIDIVVGGFPCQDVSVAGLRKGLEDAEGNRTRSGLFFDAMRIVRWCREFNGTRFLLIENVPGLLSSKLGADFASVLGEMVGTCIAPPKDKWKNAGMVIGPDGMCEWCILDAQYFGVPQRRRRVFALVDFGNWANRPPILLEPESLCGNPPPSRETGESTSHSVASCIGASGRGFSRTGDIRGQDPVIACSGSRMLAFGEYAQDETASILKQRDYKDATDLVSYAVRTANTGANGQAVVEVYENHPNDSRVKGPLKVGNTVSSRYGTGGGNVPLVLERNGGRENVVAFQQNASGDVFSGEISGTVATNANASGRNCQMVLSIATKQYAQNLTEECAAPLCAEDYKEPQAVFQQSNKELAPTLAAAYADKMGLDNQHIDSGAGLFQIDSIGGSVRRLTPKECERLQGFPDDYTNIPWRGRKTAPDGPRYKAMGNSMAVPVMRWIGRRIAQEVQK